MESWQTLLQSGDAVTAWDEFIARYRRLIFAAIRHQTTNPDDVMDVFGHVCEALRSDGLARLRKYPADGSARANCSTWLVTVVHRLGVDWFRKRDGRDQRRPPSSLTPSQQDVYRAVFLERRPHLEAFEALRRRAGSSLTYYGFVEDLRAAQRVHRSTPTSIRAITVAVSPSIPDPAPGEDAVIVDGETRDRVNQLLAGLGNDERLALDLYVVQQMAADDVARTVGWPDAKAVYNRVSRLLKSLRQKLSDEGVAPGDL